MKQDSEREILIQGHMDNKLDIKLHKNSLVQKIKQWHLGGAGWEQCIWQENKLEKESKIKQWSSKKLFFQIDT